MKTYVVRSRFHDPWLNLALEEYLLDNVRENQILLYLWRNDSTVVLGKNQNAWKECDWKLLESEGGKLSRRLSGGGAVYHDLGNLNFTFIMDRKLYDLTAQSKVILEALKALGIEGEYTGRNDLTFQGKKFSGNAFYFREHAAYHHGTLLVHTDFSRLTRYLKVSEDKIQSKGIGSVRSRVINLAEIRKELRMEDLVESIEDSFGGLYGKPYELPFGPYASHADELYRKYASWQWRFGDSPDSDIEMQRRFSWGDADFGFQIENGRIRSAVFYSDAMDGILVEEIARQLKGAPFQKEAVAERLKQVDPSEGSRKIINDLIHWLNVNL